MLGTILTVVGGLADAAGLYKFGATLVKGDETKRVLSAIDELHVRVERLSDTILYAPGVEGLTDTANATRKLNGLRDVRELLEPVQASVGGDILSSGLIATPDKMERAMSDDPWTVLQDIRPQRRAVRPTNPDMVAVMFEHDGQRYIGWQMRGALPMLFDCELHELPGLGATLKPEGVAVSGSQTGVAAAASEPAARDPRHTPGAVWRDTIPAMSKAACPEMVTIPPGRFTMGSPTHEQGRDSDEGPQHDVHINYVFALGKYAVTFAEWDAARVAGANIDECDAEHWGRDRRPVINVSWDNAQAYVSCINAKLGLGGQADAYRLPSEAEWEYACRAGTTGPFSFDGPISSDKSNYDSRLTYMGSLKGKYRKRTVEVQAFEPNPFGLHHMHGNVWEWCFDTWHDSYDGAPKDGAAWSGGVASRRVLRGGSWYSYPRGLRSANRNRFNSTNRNISIGFRLARTVSLR